jgi:hypothetical protein
MQQAGWFEIPGVQEGQRTLQEQMQGLEPVVMTVKGKSVLDLGCAEGLIMREMSRAGATVVHGIESNASLKLLRGQTIGLWNLNEGLPNWLESRYHIVLLLAIVHKMHKPVESLKEFAARAKERVVIRLPAGSKGIITSKFYPTERCDCNAVMQESGFKLDQVLPGPRGELVQHWLK